MGTNYYWRDSPCGHCGRFEEIHVGKSMNIWRGYVEELLDDQHPEWGYTRQSPVGMVVVALADWRHVFTDRPGSLYDEYGKQIPDPVAWLDSAQPWEPGADGRKWLDEDIARGDGWLDPAGHRFSVREFS